MPLLLIYAWSILVSLLPCRYRERWSLGRNADIRTCAIVGGFLQAIIFGSVYFAALIDQLPGAMEQTGATVLQSEKGPVMDVLQVRLTTGVLGLANFALQPLNIACGYMAAEGVLRCFAAFTVDDVRGTLPLFLVSYAHGLLETVASWIKRGPLVTDEIQRPRDDTYDLHVLSCRPKPEWNKYITIRYRNKFYVLAGEEQGKRPRPFVYKLRANPAGRLIVVVRDYE